MMIEVDVPILDALLPIIVFFLETTYSRGLLNANSLCLDQVLKLSIEGLSLSSPSHVGYITYSLKNIVIYIKLLCIM